MGQNLIKSTNKRNTKSDVFLFCRSSFLKSAGLRFSKSASHASVETISVKKTAGFWDWQWLNMHLQNGAQHIFYRVRFTCHFVDHFNHHQFLPKKNSGTKTKKTTGCLFLWKRAAWTRRPFLVSKALPPPTPQKMAKISMRNSIHNPIFHNMDDQPNSTSISKLPTVLTSSSASCPVLIGVLLWPSDRWKTEI